MHSAHSRAWQHLASRWVSRAPSCRVCIWEWYPPCTSRALWRLCVASHLSPANSPSFISSFPRPAHLPASSCIYYWEHLTARSPNRPLRLQTLALLPPSLAGARAQPLPRIDPYTGQSACFCLRALKVTATLYQMVPCCSPQEELHPLPLRPPHPILGVHKWGQKREEVGLHAQADPHTCHVLRRTDLLTTESSQCCRMELACPLCLCLQSPCLPEKLLTL